MVNIMGFNRNVITSSILKITDFTHYLFIITSPERLDYQYREIAEKNHQKQIIFST